MTQALQHPLKQAFSADGYPWLIAQTYAALGLGTTGSKLKTLREQLQKGRDWLEYRDAANNNSPRICYTQAGILAIAARLGTPKALEFAQLVGRHRAETDCPGAIVVAQPQTVTPTNTTYRMARTDASGELQRLEPEAQSLQASDWQLADAWGGEMTNVNQPLSANVQGFQGLRVGMPDQVGGNVIINQGTINYTIQEGSSQGLPTISRQTWERVSVGLLVTCIAVPIFFLSLYITSSRNTYAPSHPAYQSR